MCVPFGVGVQRDSFPLHLLGVHLGESVSVGLRQGGCLATAVQFQAEAIQASISAFLCLIHASQPVMLPPTKA